MSFLNKANSRPEWNTWLKVGTVVTEINYEQLMQKWEKCIHVTNRLTVAKEVGIIHVETRTDVCLLNLGW